MAVVVFFFFQFLQSCCVSVGAAAAFALVAFVAGTCAGVSFRFAVTSRSWIPQCRCILQKYFAVQPCVQGVIAGSIYIRRPQATGSNAITSFNASRHILSNQQKWPKLGSRYLDHAWSILRSDTQLQNDTP